MDTCVYQEGRESLRSPFGVALMSRQMGKLIFHRQKSVPSQSKGITAIANIAPANGFHYPTKKLGRSPLITVSSDLTQIGSEGKSLGPFPVFSLTPKQHLTLTGQTKYKQTNRLSIHGRRGYVLNNSRVICKPMNQFYKKSSIKGIISDSTDTG